VGESQLGAPTGHGQGRPSHFGKLTGYTDQFAFCTSLQCHSMGRRVEVGLCCCCWGKVCLAQPIWFSRMKVTVAAYTSDSKVVTFTLRSGQCG
jgi:YD repeat-containing protein